VTSLEVAGALLRLRKAPDARVVVSFGFVLEYQKVLHLPCASSEVLDAVENVMSEEERVRSS
jgi:hypothetical protein